MTRAIDLASLVSSKSTWKIDPERTALKFANHTRTFPRVPTLQEVTESVRSQYYSGEGSLQYAPEQIARVFGRGFWEVADIVGASGPIEPSKIGTVTRSRFIAILANSGVEAARKFVYGLRDNYAPLTKAISYEEIDHCLQGIGLNPCAEIIGHNFACNLSEIHLNRFIGCKDEEIEEAFYYGGIEVASLLQHQFVDPVLAKSRDLDPIVATSLTGGFDYFASRFGRKWLEWVILGDRSDEWGGATKAQISVWRQTEQTLLNSWRLAVKRGVSDYCLEHRLKMPRRVTALQPAGSKSLLTGASSGWHPPKARFYIRRITFNKMDPVAMAAMDLGYKVEPGQNDIDEHGNLLTDPFDPRCTEWLVNVPVEVPWADLAEGLDISKMSALSQFDLWMTFQKYYVEHNSSATIELREHEIEPLAKRIHQAIVNDEGYISAALLARFDANETFPRLPFEPISKETYDKLAAESKVTLTAEDLSEFYDSMNLYLSAQRATYDEAAYQVGCDSEYCEVKR